MTYIVLILIISFTLLSVSLAMTLAQLKKAIENLNSVKVENEELKSTISFLKKVEEIKNDNRKTSEEKISNMHNGGIDAAINVLSGNKEI